MTSDEFYEHITKLMTPEDALKKLLKASLRSYEHLKFNEKKDTVPPEFIIVAAALDLNWQIAVETENASNVVRGLTVGTQEYLDSVFLKEGVKGNKFGYEKDPDYCTHCKGSCKRKDISFPGEDDN